MWQTQMTSVATACMPLHLSWHGIVMLAFVRAYRAACAAAAWIVASAMEGQPSSKKPRTHREELDAINTMRSVCKMIHDHKAYWQQVRGDTHTGQGNDASQASSSSSRSKTLGSEDTSDASDSGEAESKRADGGPKTDASDPCKPSEPPYWSLMESPTDACENCKKLKARIAKYEQILAGIHRELGSVASSE